MQVEYASVATDYEEHKSSSNTVRIDKSLCSVGDVRDELNHKGQIIRRCLKKVLDGSDDEPWIQHSNSENDVYTYFLNLEGLAYDTNTSISKAITSHFVYSYSCWNTNKQVGQFSGHPTTNTMYFNSDKTSLADFKAWLKENPVEVVYQLATPTVESIDCSNKIVQYDGQTNIYNRDGAEIEVSLTNNKAISEVNENLDIIEQKQRQMSNYSTEEQIAGTWIDGKTMYRKIYQDTLPDTTATGTLAQKSIDISNLNADMIPIVEHAWFENNYRNFPIPLYGVNSVYVFTNRANIYIQNLSANYNNAPVNIILLYTKTTD